MGDAVWLHGGEKWGWEGREGRGFAARRLAGALAAACTLAAPAGAQSLRPSRASLDLQNEMARTHRYTFLDNEAQVASFVAAGLLVPVAADGNLEINEGVSFPYARPEVASFLAELAAQFKAECGEPLVVTSLTRPRNRQPRNASPRSVHPTGMAFDLRRSAKKSCRAWLDSTLISLEKEGVLDAQIEWRPLHYHVALFPREYLRYAEDEGEVVLAAAAPATPAAIEAHIVRVGDTLWKIARRYGTTVGLLKQANGLRSNLIRPGQTLAVPEAH